MYVLFAYMCSELQLCKRASRKEEKIARDRPKVETRDVEEDSDTLESTTGVREQRGDGEAFA